MYQSPIRSDRIFKSEDQVMRAKCWTSVAWLILACGNCGCADEPKQEFKHVGNVIFVYAPISPKDQQKSKEEKLTLYHKIGEVWAERMRQVVSPRVRLKFLTEM